ncbi:zinc ribbon domain-containing protein [Streptomyces sp. NPDC020951]|uniref:zinc ribbon domain-containing protein n=1 Tax=Streptomyces sp. NPDC020951 TaxID=3365104 RepID=UPI00378CDAD5
MSRRLPLGANEAARTACARGLLRAGVVEKSGDVLSAAMLEQRVGWAAELVSGMSAGLLAGHWNAADVDVLACGEDAGGRKLPSNAWMALRRLGWTVAAPGPVRVNDRIVRMAQEQAGRALRSAKWRADLTAGVLAAWPADPSRRSGEEWDAVRDAIPGGRCLPSAVIRSRTRQIVAFEREHGRLPADVFELEEAPRAARMLLLSACDGQQATIERCETDPRRALLRLQLPTRPDPRSGMGVGEIDTHPAAGHAQGGKVQDGVGGATRTGRGWPARSLCRRRSAQVRAACADAADFLAQDLVLGVQRVSGGVGVTGVVADEPQTAPPAPPVRAPAHQGRGALAWAAARWAVDQAIAAGATVMYLEDLRSMEAKSMGRTMNTRLSQTVRGQIAEHVRHLAAEVGIAVVTVPPRNTSRHCPRCLTPLRHRKAPDRPTTAGWKWALCPNGDCGWQGDRDHGAWQRIAARGLTHQAKTVTDRTTGRTVVRTVVDILETTAVITPNTVETSRTDRSKTGPTRPRSTRPAPRRRRAPSPTRLTGPASKRPEGHAPTDRHQLPRAAHRHQNVTTISIPTTAGHRPRGAALGAGFHLHTHATPPRWDIPLPDTTSDTGSLS